MYVCIYIYIYTHYYIYIYIYIVIMSVQGRGNREGGDVSIRRLLATQVFCVSYIGLFCYIDCLLVYYIIILIYVSIRRLLATRIVYVSLSDSSDCFGSIFLCGAKRYVGLHPKAFGDAGLMCLIYIYIYIYIYCLLVYHIIIIIYVSIRRLWRRRSFARRGLIVYTSRFARVILAQGPC